MKMKPKQDFRWDPVALGEAMLRLDPGEDRIHTAQHLRLRERRGEYNVARGLTLLRAGNGHCDRLCR
jgi:2-dehydro-3-deoxygluconokinase